MRGGALQQQVVEISDAINDNAALGVMLGGAIKESVSAMQCLSEGGELRSESGVREAAARET